jgi:hypothetical protein
MPNTADLLAQLQRHYIKPGQPMPGGVFVPEVGQNGGWGAGSRCDALYVGFTNSSGRILVGHELKTSRADWLNELNQPGKADAWADECHEWWLVVSDPAIVHPGELPADWGLMSPGTRTKTRMTVHTRAVRKAPATHRPSWNAVRSILARQDTLRAQAINDIRTSARQDAWEELDRRVKEGIERGLQQRAVPDAAELADKLARIQAALGGQIDWSAETRGYILASPDWIGLAELKLVADAVRATGSVQRATAQLCGRYSPSLTATRRALDELEAALAALRTAGTTAPVNLNPQEAPRGA